MEAVRKKVEVRVALWARVADERQVSKEHCVRLDSDAFANAKMAVK